MSKSIAARSRSLLPWLASFAVASSDACASPPAPPPLAATAAPSVVNAPQAVTLAPFENHGGMWLPSQVPEHAAELQKLGLAIDPALLADPKSSVLGAIVNLNGCSASFVSKDGLVVSIHHCATSALQRNSTPAEDLLKTGMLARTRAEERASGPSARLNVLAKATEITDLVAPLLAKTTDDLA